MKNFFEPTLPGNPEQLAVNQHIFPRAAIARFAVAGEVTVHRKGTKKFLRKGPSASIFVTKRKWDHETERWLSEIDTDYAEVVKQYAATKDEGLLSPRDNEILVSFFASWVARWNFAQKANTDVVLKGVAPERHPKVVEEHAERIGVVVARSVGGQCAVPSRFIYGDQLLMLTHSVERQLSSMQWYCCRLDTSASLFVPDYSERCYVPFSPSAYFVGLPRTVAPGFEPWPADQLNQEVAEHCRVFYFCRP